MAPFFEPDLEARLKEAVRQKALTAITGPSLNSQSDIAYITVDSSQKLQAEAQKELAEKG